MLKQCNHALIFFIVLVFELVEKGFVLNLTQFLHFFYEFMGTYDELLHSRTSL